MSFSEKSLMEKAFRKATEGVRKGQTPFGACIVRKGKIVALAHNVVWKTMDITAHAEIHAIRLACRKLRTINLSGSTIYSTCEPCPMCFSAIHWARISKVVYGASIRDARKIGFNELAISNAEMKRRGRSPVRIVAGFMREKAIELFHFRSSRGNRRVY